MAEGDGNLEGGDGFSSGEKYVFAGLARGFEKICLPLGRFCFKL